MAKSWAIKFYKSSQWKKCKAEFLKSKRYLCEECGETADIVHHRQPLTPDNITDESITLNWDNLEAVCIRCHNEIHETRNYLKRTGKRYKFDEYGRIAPPKNLIDTA